MEPCNGVRTGIMTDSYNVNVSARACCPKKWFRATQKKLMQESLRESCSLCLHGLFPGGPPQLSIYCRLNYRLFTRLQLSSVLVLREQEVMLIRVDVLVVLDRGHEAVLTSSTVS